MIELLAGAAVTVMVAWVLMIERRIRAMTVDQKDFVKHDELAAHLEAHRVSLKHMQSNIDRMEKKIDLILKHIYSGKPK